MGPGGDHYERVVLSRAGATPTGANKVGSTLIARVLKNKNCPQQESYLQPTYDPKNKKKTCGKHVVSLSSTARFELTPQMRFDG